MCTCIPAIHAHPPSDQQGAQPAPETGSAAARPCFVGGLSETRAREDGRARRGDARIFGRRACSIAPPDYRDGPLSENPEPLGRPARRPTSRRQAKFARILAGASRHDLFARTEACTERERAHASPAMSNRCTQRYCGVAARGRAAARQGGGRELLFFSISSTESGAALPLPTKSRGFCRGRWRCRAIGRVRKASGDFGHVR